MRRRFKYLALSEVYRVPPKGGHVVWLHEVSKRLGGVCVLSGNVEGAPRVSLSEGIELRRINLSRWAFVRPESVPLYLNFLTQGLLCCLREKPVAIISARVLPEGLIASAIGRLIGIPTMVFAHGEEINRMRLERALPPRRRLTATWKRRLLWHSYRNTDLVVANSRFTAELLLEGGVLPARVAVVNPGTDPSRFRPLPRDPGLVAELDLADKKVILTVGRLTRRKGQDIIIRALPEILKAVPQAVYVIGGTGDEEPRLRDLARLVGVSSRVRFVGSIPDYRLPAMYNVADVFAMPNRVLAGSGDLEGFGIVFLEAGACCVPVIGGRTGGVPDAIADGKTGLLVDGNSPSAVAEALIKILQSPDWACQLGRNARDRICDAMTWDHVAERIRTLLEGLEHRKMKN